MDGNPFMDEHPFMGILDAEGGKTLFWTKTLLWCLGTRCCAPEHPENPKKEVPFDEINGARPEKAGATHIRRNLKKLGEGVRPRLTRDREN